MQQGFDRSLQDCTRVKFPLLGYSACLGRHWTHANLAPLMCRRCLEICTEGMVGVPQAPDFEEEAWKREDNLPALLAFTLEKNILLAREEHRVREAARAEELRRLALAELEVGGPQGRVEGLAVCFATFLSVRACRCQQRCCWQSPALHASNCTGRVLCVRKPKVTLITAVIFPKACSVAPSVLLLGLQCSRAGWRGGPAEPEAGAGQQEGECAASLSL